MRDAAGHTVRARIKSTSPLAKLFAAFKAQAMAEGWASEGATFKFVSVDGDVVEPTATADDLGMEEEECIECHYS